MRMLQFQKHFLDWLRDRLPDDGFYTFPAMAARLTPGDLGNQMRELLNRRQRAAGQTDIVPYIPTMSPAADGLHRTDLRMLFAELPTNVDDPLERLRLTTDNLTRAKASFDAMPTELLREATEFLPRDMFDWFVDAVVRLPEDRLQVP
jgi:hypothetical protein